MIIKEIKTHRDIAIDKILSELPKVKLLQQEIELATLDKDDDVVKRKTLELNVYKGNIEAQVRDRSQYISSEIDGLLIKIQAEENILYKEAFAKLNPDPKIRPRNFSAVSSSFGGDNANIAPIDFITPKD